MTYLERLHGILLALCKNIPVSLVTLLARFTLAAVFWHSGQTKIEGFAVNFITGEWDFGWPHMKASTLFLFQEEYNLPLIPPLLGAYLATFIENVGAVFLLFGLATRWVALVFLGMVFVIQFFVYSSAYVDHGLWATGFLFLLIHGGGKISLDYGLMRLFCPSRN